MKNTVNCLLGCLSIIASTQLFVSESQAWDLSSNFTQPHPVDFIAGGPPINITDNFSFTTQNYVVRIYTQGGMTYVSVSDRKTGMWLNNIPVSVSNIPGGRLYSLLKGETNVKIYRYFADNSASIVVGDNRPEISINGNNNNDNNNSSQNNFAFFTKTYLVKIYTINGQTYMDVSKRDTNMPWISGTKAIVTSNPEGWSYKPERGETNVIIFKSRYSNSASIQVGNNRPESAI
jgi:hypothetical protein